MLLVIQKKIQHMYIFIDRNLLRLNLVRNVLCPVGIDEGVPALVPVPANDSVYVPSGQF